MPPELVRETKAIAARRGQTLTKVVSEALARTLSVEGDVQDQPGDLEREMAWFRKHRSSLLRRYAGEYVAIIDASIVDHARDFDALAARVFARYGNRNIYMPRVEATERIARIRSPRKAST